MLQYAKSQGLEIPDWFKAYEVPSAHKLYGHNPAKGQITMMQYVRNLPLDTESLIYWDNPKLPQQSISRRVGGNVGVEIKEGLLRNDEAFLHYLAHEIHELRLLKEAMDEAGGALQSKTVAELIDPTRGGPNSLHNQAWQYADDFIEKRRR